MSDTHRHSDRPGARSALRSSQRMRRLVADLLLLARTDVGRVVPRKPCDLAQIVVEAAGELGPVSADHDIMLDVHPAIVEAARDELREEIRATVEATLARAADDEIREVDLLQRMLHDDLGQLVYDRLKRRPMMLPVVVEV